MIACIGNPVFDRIQTLRTKSKGRVLSGCSTNACLALSKLELETALIGRVGPDFYTQFLQDMDRFGIPSNVEHSEVSGGFELIYFDDQGNRTLNLLGDAGKISIFPQVLSQSDWILIGPILREIDLDYVKKIKSTTQAKLFVDPQGLLRFHSEGSITHMKTDEVEAIASLSDVFKPNELECKVLTGIDPRENFETPAIMIHSWGAKLVIITLAELGSVIYDGVNFFRIPAYETEVLDSTGAGDTYAAGILYALTQDYGLFEAGCFAACVSSIKIEHCGPDFPLTLAEAERRKAILLR
jgi:sugar/nucleoside kinase (ribokinase family)